MAFLAMTFLALLAGLLFIRPLQPLSKVLLGLWIVLAAALFGRLRLLLKDWSVFVAFLYFADSLRETIYVLTCKLHLPVHALYILKLEKALFGEVPSVALQAALLRTGPAGHFSWLEKTLTVIYGSHFVAFVFVGLFIWVYRPGALAKYKASFYLLIPLGFFFYAVVPTAPPWMASGQFGVLAPLVRFNRVLFDSTIPTLTSGFDLNPVSAMPSLHAGFPILCCLLLWGLYRSKALPFILYTLAVLFTIVYTGDHYVVDILAGTVLAVFSSLIAGRLLKRRDGPSRGEARPSAWAELKKPALAGLVIFLAGVGLSQMNGALVTPGVNFYDTNVPRFADFFRNEGRYRDSFLVQLYFGNHYLAWKDASSALPYFRRSLKLARTPAETREAQGKIDLCRR